MKPHRFDPISASLGVVAIAAGALVAFDAVESTGAGWWLALAALVVGLGLVPWTGDRTSTGAGPSSPPPDEPVSVNPEPRPDPDPGPAPRFRL